jgi:hypothetical protein
MSRKIPDFKHVILNSIQNLSETGDASCEKIPHREPALECLRRAE